MDAAFTTRPSAVLADLVPGSLVRDAGLCVGGAALTGAAAQVAVHTSLTPVPFTLQTGAVLLIGAALGSLRGVVSMLVYALAGGAGVPWFAGHTHGFGGPSFGYIVGFVLAAFVVGRLAQRGKDRDTLASVGMMMLGSLCVYVCGVAWLAHDLNLTFSKAMQFGVQPFVVGDAVKIAVAAPLLPLAWRVVRAAEERNR